MKVLGIESSCDECAASVVEDGQRILSNVVATQIPFHAVFQGVVPEIASRTHTQWIVGVVKNALTDAGLKPDQVDAVAATAHPGLLGSLLVGLNFGKSYAWSLNLPFIAVDHMLAHLYAPQLQKSVAYPFLGLLVSGGHTIICRVDDFDDITVLGTTIDDAVGEAFDKVSKFYGFGYPGGAYIDRLAARGNPDAFRFPLPNLYKGEHRYDVSYSGLKTAVINQLDQFRSPQAHRGPLEERPFSEDNIRGETNPRGNGAPKPEDVAASFQKTAVEILLRSLFRAVEDTGLTTIVAGGGVAANSYLRSRLAERRDLICHFPPLELCGDNGAMVAGIAHRYLVRGDRSPLDVTSSARVRAFKRRYP